MFNRNFRSYFKVSIYLANSDTNDSISENNIRPRTPRSNPCRACNLPFVPQALVYVVYKRSGYVMDHQQILSRDKHSKLQIDFRKK